MSGHARANQGPNWSPWSMFSDGAEEMVSAARRRKLRLAQKEELMRRQAFQAFRPRPDNIFPGVIQDPNSVRWLAMHYSRVDYVPPRYRFFARSFFILVVPVGIVAWIGITSTRRVDREVGSGQVPYHKRPYKVESHYSQFDHGI